MSKPTPIEIVCPFCAAKNRVKVWLNLNSQKDTAQIEEALSGKLFEVECKGCKCEIPLEHSLHFHDPECLQYYRFDSPTGGLQARAEELAESGVGYSLRRTANFSSLLELLHIWNENLDDAPMLLMKHMLAAEVEQLAGEPPLICNFSHVDRSSGEPSLEFVVVEGEESDPQNAGVPYSLYNYLVEKIEPIRNSVFPKGVWVEWDFVTAGRAMEAMGKGVPA